MVKDVIVKKSKTHGKGVFAARDFKKGEKVIVCGFDKIMSAEEAARISLKDWSYVCALDEKRYALFKSPACFVNHSCEPNVGFGKGAFKALAEIKKGAELTADYEKGMVLQQFLCKCGSKHCRHVIAGR